MRHVLLHSFRDEVTGELGLGVAACKGDTLFSARDGALLAHDIVEHQNGFARIGCPEDELEAVGAIWQVRGRHGTLFNEDRGPWRCLYESIAGDVETTASDWDSMENRRWYPRWHQYRTHRHDYDEDFQEIIDKARPNVRANMADYESDMDVEAFLDNALHLMRRGFNKAKRRFGMGYLGADTYCAIRDAVHPHAKNVEFEGQHFRLSYGNGRARCEEIYPDLD